MPPMSRRMTARQRKFMIGLGMLIVVGMILVALVMLGNMGEDEAVNDRNRNDAAETRAVPGIWGVQANSEQVGQYEKFELKLDVAGEWENPYDPDEVDLGALFTSPSGKAWTINGFYDGREWLIRFAPDEIGEWIYVVHLITGTGEYRHQALTFTVEKSSYHGGLTVPAGESGRFLAYRDGTPFFAAPLAYPWGVTESGLDRIKAAGGNLITYWNGNYDHAGNGGGVQQLESNQTGPGRYDPQKGDRVDELLDWLEQRGMMMNFVVWPHDSLAHNINWPATWSQNAYSSLGEATEFYSSEEMWQYQEKLYRYMIARWGHSRAFGIWDLIVEVNGTDGWQLGDAAKADEWLTRIHAFFRDHDPYRHPTMGSMAGNREDYWGHAYETLDIADRENYYNLHHTAFAEDIQLRWKSYRKPLWIGETGNVTDPAIYHRTIWTGISNGLAGLPTWWTEEHMNEDMLESMKHAVEFMQDIDLAEGREPLAAEPKWSERQLPATLNLLQFDTYSSWALPSWADANKDSNGVVYELTASGEKEQLTIHAEMRFATGSYAQGVLEGIPDVHDWSGYELLEVEIFVDGKDLSADSASKLRAKVVLHPDGQWREAADVHAAQLQKGSWVKLQVPLRGSAGYWQDVELAQEQLNQIARVGVKLYCLESDADAGSVTVQLRGLKLVSSTPPVQRVKRLEGWMMRGGQTSYGWVVSDEQQAGGEEIVFENWGSHPVEVAWYDPWMGEWAGPQMRQQAQPGPGGDLTLQVPADYKKQDIAFVLIRHLKEG